MSAFQERNATYRLTHNREAECRNNQQGYRDTCNGAQIDDVYLLYLCMSPAAKAGQDT